VLINTSPEPFTNWAASIAEDVAVVAGVWAAVQHPWLFLAAFALFVVLMIWLLPKIARGIAAVLRSIVRLFRGESATPPAPSAPAPHA
jgi:hypothetical protein